MHRLIGRRLTEAGRLGCHAAIVPSAGPAARRDAVRRLAAEALGRPLDEVAIRHEPGCPPRLVAPAAGAGLVLSSASRGDWAAVAAGPRPLGIDVERVDTGVQPPWNVLHPREAAALRALAPAERARAFARLWTLKEAFLKATGEGLLREPRTVEAVVSGACEAIVSSPAAAARAVTWWLDGRTVVSLAVLAA